MRAILFLCTDKNNTAEGLNGSKGSLNDWNGFHDVLRDSLEFAGKKCVFWSFVVCAAFDNDIGDGANDEIDKTIESTKGKHSKGCERMDNSKTLHFTLASRHLLDDGSANSFGYF